MAAPVAQSLTRSTYSLYDGSRCFSLLISLEAPEVIQKLDDYVDVCISANIGTVLISDVQAKLDIGVQRNYVPFPTADDVFRREVDAKLSYHNTYDCAEWSSNDELKKGPENSRDQAEIRVEEIAGNLTHPLSGDYDKIVCHVSVLHHHLAQNGRI
jgi:hypothetical protein